ncbi:MAG: LegC family aminotransferase [Pseudomonadota bacterium]
MTQQTLAEQVTAAIHNVVGSQSASLHEPIFAGHEWDYVKECLDTGWVSSVGNFVDRFEHDLATWTGARHVVAVVNGTAALQVALLISGVRSGDEVMIPSLSFVATANAVSHAGATPHFVDSSEETLGLCPLALSDYLADIIEQRNGQPCNRLTGRRISAIVPMHTFGHPVDMPALQAVAEKHGIVIVEDAAESLGSWLGDRHTGTFGRCGVLSFNGNKVITTGGGGAILTDDPELARRAKHLTTTAKLPHRWAFQHDEIAFNYRMPNLNAALGCAQLEQMDGFLFRKRQLAERYLQAFAGLDKARLFTERAGTRVNYWLQTLLLDTAVSDQRDAVLAATNDAGLMTRPIWELLHTLPMYINCPKMPLTVVQTLSRRIINIPSSASLIHG